MTAAQPNNLGYLAGTVGDDDLADVTHREAEPKPTEYAGDLPDDPQEARRYRPDRELPDREQPDRDDG